MPLSREEVEHIARLAHIRLQPEEVDALRAQLSSIVDHVTRLRRLPTDQIEPTSHAIALADVTRDDVVGPSWNPQAVLANAPRSSDSLFEVQAILD
jgi:aspartyl-tRNA(Asn)/glutamyl-tRNA(Gln) amidotransferase subunit C